MSSALPAHLPEATTRGKNRWARAALYLLPFVVLDVLLVVAWSRGEIPAGAGLVLLWFLTPWQVGIVLWASRDSDYPGVYNLPPEPARTDRWRLDPPGVPFGFVFPRTLMALAVLGAILVFGSGSKWAFGETLGLTVAWLAGAIALGFLLRSRPRLEVDEVRRELVWHPDTLLDDRLTLPFSAITSVRLGFTFPHHNPEIVWRTKNEGINTTQLPSSVSRESMEAVVARLRAAVGLPPLVVSPPPVPEGAAAGVTPESPAAWYDSHRWWARAAAVLLGFASGPTWRSDAGQFAFGGVVFAVLVWVIWTFTASNTERFGRRERWVAWALVGLLALWAVGRWVGNFPPLSR